VLAGESTERPHPFNCAEGRPRRRTVDAAFSVSEVNSLWERILGSAVLYDGVQRAAGLERLKRRVAPTLNGLGPGTLLDVGAGTGSFYELLPRHVKYVPLDMDRRKLDRLSGKHSGVEGVVGSATALPFDDDSFDCTLCTNVAHHLSDQDFEAMLDELARVTRRQLVFVDPLRTRRVASKALWRIDRGSYPRSFEQLLEKLSARFTSQDVEAFTILHTYVLYVGGPVDS
jgi:ubiquinone/menaquinone biosynthesis C-methylase UbiE